MEILNLEDDINVVYVQAESFPDGIMGAHQKLHTCLPDMANRRVFGISRPENGEISYKAAAELKEGDQFDLLRLETFTITKGKYLSELVKDFMADVSQIGETFQRLINEPNIDPQGYCVEDYINDVDVRCMVRLKGEK